MKRDPTISSDQQAPAHAAAQPAASRRRFEFASLKSRVLLLVTVAIVIGIWTLATDVTTKLKRDLEKNLSDHLTQMVGYVADDFDEGVRIRRDTLVELAAALGGDDLAHPQRTRDVLDRHGVSNLLFPTGVFVVDRRGRIVADAGAVIPGRLGRSVADRDYFYDVLRSGRPIIGRPILGRVTRAPTVVIGAPLLDVDGTVGGILAASIEIMNNGMFGEIEKLAYGNGGYSILFSPRERIIVAATDKSRIFSPLPAPGVVPLLDRRIDEGFEGAGITVNSAGVEVLTANRRMKSTGWILVTAVPTEEAFATLATLRSHVYAVALAITAGVALLLWFGLRRQLRPLEDIGQTMRNMSDGAAPFAALPLRRADEIGRLVKHFNRLVNERQRREAELLRHRNHLQDLVREQTADLVLAKEAAETANAAKSQFLAKMSDQLRTPLQEVLSYSGLGKELADRSPPQRLAGYFAEIGSGGRQLLQMINDLLDLSKLEADKMTMAMAETDLAGIVRRIGGELEPLLAAKSLRLQISEAPAVPRVFCDEGRIAQVVRNLLANAIQFSPADGGEITATIDTAAMAADQGDSVRLRIADQGPGIAAAEIESVFEIFAQGSAASGTGAGLGLAICRKIVAAHNGRIGASNAPGCGAVFEVLLPAAAR